MNKDRLLKLAAHIISDKVGHKEFNFNHYNTGFVDAIFNTCGTSGCAIGECPIAFPDEWLFSIGGMPILSSGHYGTEFSARKFFDLSEGDYEFLFLPNTYGVTYKFNKFGLPPTATAKMVSDRIIEYCDK